MGLSWRLGQVTDAFGRARQPAPGRGALPHPGADEGGSRDPGTVRGAQVTVVRVTNWYLQVVLRPWAKFTVAGAWGCSSQAGKAREISPVARGQLRSDCGFVHFSLESSKVFST